MYEITENLTNLYYIWCKFIIIVEKIDAGSAPSKGAIWDKFSEQHQHQSITNVTYLMPSSTILVHLRCTF